MRRLPTILATVLLTLGLAGGAAFLAGWLHPGGAGDPSASPGSSGKKLLYYRNPMDPTITSPVPAKDWMGMDYIPIYEGEENKPAGGSEAEDFFAADERAAGRADVVLTPEQLRLAGVVTAPATAGRLGRPLRASALVVPDERRVRSFQARTGGWVEKLSVNFSGQAVRRGQTVLSLYSPDLYATEEELLKARAAEKDLPGGAGSALTEAARQRLLLFGVDQSFIDDLERTGRPLRAVPLAAPFAGLVTGKEVREGQRVEPGQELFTLSDLSTVWVEAELFEGEGAGIAPGLEGEITVPGAPSIKGQVTFVQPVVDPATRTVRVRLEAPNPGLLLKPGMFAEVAFSREAAEGVLVPDSAVLETGTRALVYVEKGKGTFTPRQVVVGAREKGMALLLSGVREGEVVATGAAFLLDSESRVGAASLDAARKASRRGTAP